MPSPPGALDSVGLVLVLWTQEVGRSHSYCHSGQVPKKFKPDPELGGWVAVSGVELISDYDGIAMGLLCDWYVIGM